MCRGGGGLVGWGGVRCGGQCGGCCGGRCGGFGALRYGRGLMVGTRYGGTRTLAVEPRCESRPPRHPPAAAPEVGVEVGAEREAARGAERYPSVLGPVSVEFDHPLSVEAVSVSSNRSGATDNHRQMDPVRPRPRVRLRLRLRLRLRVRLRLRSRLRAGNRTVGVHRTPGEVVVDSW